ncbi:glycerophosphoryl diester phosphodiesterase [Ketogulonicigenium robustum]|uniref:Glycerophosphoryl diester phosphodiesterase n=1 Tax=Ketogulonicigenium robustum TaxID=92947 RepID=A0A1W6P1E8_9RHOB|nr:glycerophosphodiester phosphodiesterase family protein [Ketogulonicigenium robustum]ARO15264.1 glycerophosphoryl diester phosphodiesterase [Ketogulonicigenium robustum]
MTEPLFIDHAHGRTWLKWHRGRRQAGDMEFDPARILQGLRAGARVEVDLVRHAGGGFAVLHDETLDRGTDGHGRVDAADAETIRRLRRRNDHGALTQTGVALLGDLCAALAAHDLPAGAQLQLDMKETSATLQDADIAAFVQAVQPVQRHMILSGGDAQAVARLSAELPDLATGYDPCHFGALERLDASGDYAGFAARALQAAGDARMIYLDYRVVLSSAVAGFDLVGAIGRPVDAYTLQRVTADTVGIAQQLMALGVAQITTDDPLALWSALQG